MSYLLVYFIILLLFYLAVQMKYSKRNYKKVVFYILIILVILIPSLFAGLRSINIGTDTRGYLSNDFPHSIQVHFVSLVSCILLCLSVNNRPAHNSTLASVFGYLV